MAHARIQIVNLTSTHYARLPSMRQRKRMIHAAGLLTDLRVPPGNRLEALSGDRKGQHSIRINDQYRICLVWNDNDGAHEIEIVDYHS
jgi:proteic killer suppression protein